MAMMPKGIDTGLMQLAIDLDRICSFSEEFRATLGEIMPHVIARASELDSDLVGDVRDELTRLCGAAMMQVNSLLLAEEKARGVDHV
ncbi:hypothetical protein CYK25_005505 [Varibaculum cambriense]|nr:hypothetical protein CYK25_005505 [Varibaculum cambriense]